MWLGIRFGEGVSTLTCCFVPPEPVEACLLNGTIIGVGWS